MKKIISIIVPCLNEAAYIGKCIDSLINNKADAYNIEIIIIDGGSNNETLKVINTYQKDYSFIKLISNPQKITPISLNMGIKNSIGDYILIASAHSSFQDGYLAKCLDIIEKTNADVVGGTIETKPLNNSLKANSIAAVLANRFGVGNSMFRTGINKLIEVDTVPFGLYKRNIFEEVGLYNEKLIRNQDIELSKRIINAGKKILLFPEVSCVYYSRETYFGIAQNNFLNGLWNIRTVYLTRNYKSLSIRHFVPLAFVSSLILPIILSLFSNYFMFLSIFILLIYTCTITVVSLRVNNKTKRFLFIWFSFIILHFSYGIGSLIGLFKLK